MQPDLFRQQNPYSSEIQTTTTQLMEAVDDDSRALILGQWLMQHQPCIFGKLAAARGLITYCFLTDEDLSESDENVLSKIQAARREWKSLAEHGKRSAFIILALSTRLTNAQPDENLKRFAIQLATLYLNRTVTADKIYTDSIKLWSLRFTEERRWGVGVNVFTIQGDQRWWHDHRIPGGVAFSMNSVGHMVASEARRTAILNATKSPKAVTSSTKLEKLTILEAEMAKLSQTSIQSLSHALKYAMHTIDKASYQTSGACNWPRATFLMREGPDSICPFPLIASDTVLKTMNWTTYAGWYHTDMTIPSEYFLPGQAKPQTIESPIALDFSYLHSRREPDYKTLAQGQLIKRHQRIRAIK